MSPRVEKDGELPLEEENGRNDDAALFREAMRDVKPLTKTGKITHPRPEPRSFLRPRVTVQPDIQDTLSDSGLLEMTEDEELSFARPGLQRHALRKLRRGYWHIRDELDLHGLTRDVARRMLTVFLDNSVLRGYRCVRVIHGRGLSSKDRRPVLKILLGHWLVQRNDVLAFCQARPEQGGSGAVLILLRNPDK